MTLSMSRADLLNSSPLYDKHRDSDRALPLGTRIEFHTYTGGTVIDDGTVDLSRDREMYLMRTQPELFPDWLRNVRENARVRVATHADRYDWDCTKCHTAVMTESLADVCPNCLL